MMFFKLGCTGVVILLFACGVIFTTHSDTGEKVGVHMFCFGGIVFIGSFLGWVWSLPT